MKKSIVIAVLGLTAGAVSSFGQGTITFNSYIANNSVGILTTYGNGITGTGHSAGLGLDAGWTAGLLYSLTSFTDSATTDSATASNPLLAGLTTAPNTAIYQTSAGGTPGYYQGSPFQLAGGTDGQTVFFEVVAYQTGLTYATSTVRGHSAEFSGVLHSGVNQPVNMDNMQTFSVFAVPEPTTLALAGLGGLASLVMLRRKTA
jgi:hypothetical protein